MASTGDLTGLSPALDPQVGERFVLGDIVSDVLRPLGGTPVKYAVRRLDVALGRMEVVELTVAEIFGRPLMRTLLSPDERALPLTLPNRVHQYPLRLVDDLTAVEARSHLWGVLRIETIPGGNGPAPLRNYVPGRRLVSLIVDDAVHKGWGGRSALNKWALNGWMSWLHDTVKEACCSETAAIVARLAEECAHSNLCVGVESISEAEAADAQRALWHLDLRHAPSGAP